MSEIAMYAIALLCYAGIAALFLNVWIDWSEEE